tara:strand:- start:2792 stop:2995 length:204 start_codon:yes stop_codon:yes gene_type:complete
MRRYQIVFYCSKTKETKIDIIINYSFRGAYAYSQNKILELKNKTYQNWKVASIYDLEVEFELDKNLT